MKWPMVKLGDVVDIKGGGTPSKETPEYWGGDIPWVSVKDFKSSLIDTASDYITTLGLEKSATNLIPSGTIVVPARMAVGKVAVLGTDMAINQDLKALIIKNDEELDKRFLLRFLESRADHILKFAKGATVKGITLDVLKDLDVPLPPLEEQKRIAAILDKADAIRRKRQQAIKLADEFLRSVFLDMFGDPVINPKGWEEKALLSLVIGKFQNGAYFPKEEYSDEGVEMVHMADAFYDVIQRGSLKRVLASDTDIAKYGLTYEDLMISRRSLNYEGAAKPSLIPNSDEPLIFESSMIRITPDKSQVDIRYLFQYLSDSLVKDHFIRKFVTGATIKGISQKNLEQVRILVPPMKLQRKFTDIVNKLAVTSIKLKVSEENTVDIFNGLSQKAFTGKL